MVNQTEQLIQLKSKHFSFGVGKISTRVGGLLKNEFEKDLYKIFE